MSAMFTLKIKILLVLKAKQQNSTSMEQVGLVYWLKPTTLQYYKF